MKIVYISSSIIPSRTANSIHVMKMCQALAKSGKNVTLLVPDNYKGAEKITGSVYDFYGVEQCFRIIKLPWLNIKGRGYIYGMMSAIKAKKLNADLVFGRNTIGCALAAFAGLPVIFESHSPVVESGRVTSWFFDKLSNSKNLIKLVVITKSLKKHYVTSHPHLTEKIHVAPDGADPVSQDVKQVRLANAGKRMQVGYVGNLYKGKGMEIIAELAKCCNWADFHIVGGLEADIDYWKLQCSEIKNIEFHGFVTNSQVASYQNSFDVLLLPNKENVNAHGKGRSNIGSWTSPLKMFEYMAAQKPIVASNLTVLQEVLINEHNALLCDPENVIEWKYALERLRDDTNLGRDLSNQAYHEFIDSYTWLARAEKLVN